MRAKINSPPNIQREGGITIDNFLSRLDKVRKLGKHYIARCPAHDDGRPSLRVSQGDKCILVKCWAGCSFDEIVFSMDLRPQDLFTDSLSEEAAAEYRYRGLKDKIKNVEFRLFFYDAEMYGGDMDDEGRKVHRDSIEEINNLFQGDYKLPPDWTVPSYEINYP